MTIQEIALNFDQIAARSLAGLYLPVPGNQPVRFVPTIFIDRDGVINQNRSDHVLRWDDFQFIESSKKALAMLNQAGYQVIIVTNQAQIERGRLTVNQLDYLHQRMIEEIEGAGGRVAAVYYCPHRPESNCDCRKPRPGMLLQAAGQLQLNLVDCWFIGDHLTDVEAGLTAGCKPLLVLTGRGQAAATEWQALQSSKNMSLVRKLGQRFPEGSFQLPVKADLLAAIEFILAERSSLLLNSSLSGHDK